MKKTNKMFPGRAYYTGPTSGWFGLLHHGILYEWSHDVMERVLYVLKEKPANERAVRLHNMIFLGGLKPAGGSSPGEKILAYIKKNIPDCAWNGEELDFTKTPHSNRSNQT